MKSRIIYALMTESGMDETEFIKQVRTFEEIKRMGFEAAVVYKTLETHPQKEVSDHLLSKNDLETLEKFGFRTRVQPEGSLGVGSAIKDAIKFAYELSDSEQDVIVYIEPDKFGVVKDTIKIVEPILSGRAELVIPRRSQRSFATYPKFQQFTEKELGTPIWNKALGKETDLYFSVHAYSRKIAPIFFNYPGDTWTVHYSPILLINPELIDSSIIIDGYNFPKEDFQQEDGNREIQLYRCKQVRQCTIEPLKRLKRLSAPLNKLEKTILKLEDKIRKGSLSDKDLVKFPRYKS